MTRVAPINLPYNPRTLWFDPGDLEIHRGDPVIVETKRGVEFGTAAEDIIDVDDNAIKNLKSPLKPVVRIASDEDVAKAEELDAKGREAFEVFKEMASEDHDDMHPVSVEFLFDGDKAVFYFESEERVDFRDLVRKLASHFHMRIDMRQIGVRDEARIVGGLGHCGQELCCKRLGGEFNPVSIRMAKEQDLSLNPQKISGLCGRLMCCLRYEFDAYKDFKSRAPRVNDTIETPDGLATVVELDVPREMVALRIEEEKPVKVHVSYLEIVDGKPRPSCIGSEAWENARAESGILVEGQMANFLTSQFTGVDKLADGGVRRLTGGVHAKDGAIFPTKEEPASKRSARKHRQGSDGTGEEAGGRRKRVRRRQKSEDGSAESQGRVSTASARNKKQAGQSPSDKPSDDGRKLRRRRSTTLQTQGQAAEGTMGARQSSGAGSGKATGSGKAAGSGGANKQQPAKGQKKPTPRKPSRGSSGQHGATGRQNPSGKSPNAESSRPEANGGSSRPRPGQRSSGLRGLQSQSESRDSAKRSSSTSESSAPSVARTKGNASEGAASSQQGHRKPRRRSHSARGGVQGKEGKANETSHGDEGR